MKKRHKSVGTLTKSKVSGRHSVWFNGRNIKIQELIGHVTYLMCCEDCLYVVPGRSPIVFPIQMKKIFRMNGKTTETLVY